MTFFFAVHIAVVIGIAIAVAAAAAIALIAIAPWKRVREEPPLDEDIESRLLLNEDPKQIAADQDRAEAERAAGLAKVRELEPLPPTDSEAGEIAAADESEAAEPT
jgi:hypothetical protein